MYKRQEQDGVCAYSLRRLDVERLLEPGYVDVDHIVPYSLSFDDRRSNKVLVLSSENRQDVYKRQAERFVFISISPARYVYSL